MQTPMPASTGGQAALLETLKEELFTLEQDKISGKVSPTKYAETLAGLEAMLKRVLVSKH